jgi:peptide-methionine (S)-S-oxide reductase
VKGDILTKIIPYTSFYDAEDYHQNYKKKNYTKYSFYRWNCGRDKRLGELWNGSAKHE